MLFLLCAQAPLYGRTACEQLLPDTTMMALIIRDGDKLGEDMKNTALAKIYGEPQVKAFVDKLLSRILKNKAADFKFLINSDSALAINISPKSTSSLRVILVTKAEGAKAKLTALMSKYAGQGAGAKTFEGISATVYTVPQMGETVLIQKDGFTLLGETNMVRNALQVLAGKHASLADTPGYRASTTTISKGPAAIAYINVPRFFELAGKTPSGAVFMQHPAAKILGLRAMQGLIIACWPSPPGITDKATLVIKGPGSELWSVLFSGRIDMKDFGLVPADAQAAGICEIKLYDTLTQVEKMLSANPETLQQYQQTMQAIQMLAGFHPKNDLLASINGKLILYTYPPEQPAAIPMIRLVAMLGTTDSEKLALILKPLAAMAKGVPENIAGKSAWKFMFPMSGTQAGPLSLYLVPASPWTIIGTDKGDIEAALKGAPSKPINADPDFKRVMNRLTQNAWAIGYNRYKGPYILIHKQLESLLAQMPGKSDLPTLPPAESISKHLFPGGYRASFTTNGVEVEYWSPTGIITLAGPATATGILSSRLLSRKAASPVGRPARPAITLSKRPAKREPIKIRRTPAKPVRKLTPKDRLVSLGLGAIIFQIRSAGRLPREVGDISDFAGLHALGGGLAEAIIPHGGAYWPVRSPDKFIVVYLVLPGSESKRLVLYADGKIKSQGRKELAGALRTSQSLVTR